MTKMVLLNSRIFVSGADLSGQGNKMELVDQSEAKAVTNWRSGGAEEYLAGLTSVEISAEGQWEAGDLGRVDDATWANRRALEPWTFAPSEASDTAAGNLMYLAKALRTKSTLWGDLGDVAGWTADAKGTWPLCRGQSAHPSGTPRTATGNGTSLQLGAVPSGKYLYANLHVLSVAGTTPSITVNVQSDNATGFPSPAAVGSFAAATAIGGQALRFPGPITDDWFRVTWTISGTLPSFLFLASLGIE